MNEQLLASYWTHSNAAGPLTTDHASPVPLMERIEIAGRIGWSGLGLLLADLEKTASVASFEEIADHCKRNGIEHLEFEFLDKWWEGESNPAAWNERKRFLEVTRRMSVETIKISPNLDLTAVPFETYVRELRLLADQAADAGAQVAMEFIPFAHFSDPRSASELIIAADHPMAGLCVDVWHVYRSGIREYNELTAMVPHEKIFLVELDDAARVPRGTVIEDSCNWRKYPGEGEFDVPAFVRAIRKTGFSGHWGVEIISEEHRATPAEDGMRRAFEASKATLHAAAIAEGSGGA